MDYVIKNNKNVYIKLNKNGKPVTCNKYEKTLFERSKATNIINSLPKTLRKLNFKVECIPDIKPKQKTIQKDSYAASDEIKRWIDKFGTCEDIIYEAKERMDFLLSALKRTDDEFLDILHIIEIGKPKDLYGGWLIYKKIKENREKRRYIKDEILIIGNVLEEINPNCLKRDRIRKAIDGLFTRKYTFKVVEDESDNDAIKSLKILN